VFLFLGRVGLEGCVLGPAAAVVPT
jgi:hypothetical protein